MSGKENSVFDWVVTPTLGIIYKRAKVECCKCKEEKEGVVIKRVSGSKTSICVECLKREVMVFKSVLADYESKW